MIAWGLSLMGSFLAALFFLARILVTYDKAIMLESIVGGLFFVGIVMFSIIKIVDIIQKDHGEMRREILRVLTAKPEPK
tara:strand:- start:1088 stop:1324 length:237 start_codon:yes stop_codon:yes gene_type:complete